MLGDGPPGLRAPGPQGSGQQEDDEADQRRELDDPDDLQDIRKGLFARLVPEQRAARERADRAAQPGEHQQIGLADPPLSRRRLRLVDPERGKGHQIHGREPDDDIHRRDQRKPIHARGISHGLVEEGFAGWVLRRPGGFECPTGTAQVDISTRALQDWLNRNPFELTARLDLATDRCGRDLRTLFCISFDGNED